MKETISIKAVGRNSKDAITLASVFAKAFKDEASVRWMYHIPDDSQSPNAKRRAALDASASALQAEYVKRMHLDPYNRTFVAYDDATGAIAGMSTWEIPTSNIPHYLSEQNTLYERLLRTWYRFYDSLIHWYRARYSCLAPIYSKRHQWAEVQARFRESHIKDSDVQNGYWALSWLGVYPEYGRRGIGQQLLQWGLDRADEEDRAVVLSASSQGVGLYQKFGFEVCEQKLCYPDEEEGGWTETYMRRPPRSERVEEEESPKVHDDKGQRG